MNRIDAHQHFWKFDPVRDAWITDDMSVIQRDFLPSDLEPYLKKNKIDGCVAVQADQSENETQFLLSLAEKYNWIKAVVGWIDLQDPSVEEKIQPFLKYKKLKGFRHILQGEMQRDLMLSPAFKKGIAVLEKYGYTYDILIFPDQLKYIAEFVAQFSNMRFVIDHLAKPENQKGNLTDWKKYMSALGTFENLYCKISGMVTEGKHKEISLENYRPFMDTVVESFGNRRIMFGSDWPVCLLAADYGKVVGITESYFSEFSKEDQSLFFGGNAIEFYNLSS